MEIKPTSNDTHKMGQASPAREAVSADVATAESTELHPTEAVSAAQGISKTEDTEAVDTSLVERVIRGRAIHQLRIQAARSRARTATKLSAAGIDGTPVGHQVEIGPDGQRYTISTEVAINSSPVLSLHGTIAKARRLRAAAMMSDNPSVADLSLAAQASQIELEARAELAAMAMRDDD